MRDLSETRWDSYLFRHLKEENHLGLALNWLWGTSHLWVYWSVEFAVKPIWDLDFGFFSVEVQPEILGTETTYTWDKHLDIVAFKFS